jgi:hypothetical protein
MRVIWSGIGITAGAGKVGGTVASRNANGSYLKKRTKPANPNTIPQQRVRSTLGFNSRQWKTLTPIEQETWISQAPNYPYKNKLGVTAKYTGFQLFSKVNNQLAAVDIARRLEIGSPVEVYAVSDIQFGTLSNSDFTIDIVLSSGGTTVTVVPANTSVIVQVTRQVTAGKYAPKRSIFRQIDYYPPADSLTGIDLFADYQSLFGTPVVGSKIFVQAYCVSHITGQTGKALFNGSVVS